MSNIGTEMKRLLDRAIAQGGSLPDDDAAACGLAMGPLLANGMFVHNAERRRYEITNAGRQAATA